MIPPRIRGRVGTADEGPHKGKWFYEVSIWDFTGEHQQGEPFQIGPFKTEEAACEAGREAVKIASDTIEKQVTGQTSDKYLDMKNGGILRPWKDHS